MIPLCLSITGFLSYREPIELDLTAIDLACIAGSNGAGKSSLLDAITWALFGQARKRDDSLINAQSEAAEVRLVFSYEGNVYRVTRVKPRDKTALLEFHIRQGDDLNGAAWKPLTERTLRDTENLIQQTLRLDYETFVNAAFFLQGKADQFTQQRPGDRKRILSSVLGLEVWETYRQRAADRRRAVEVEIAALEARLQDITLELAEEDTRRSRLKMLEADLKRLAQARQTQEATLENIRKIAASLAERRRLVEAQRRQVDQDQRRLGENRQRLAARRQERDGYAAALANAAEIEAAYAAWQACRAEVERWDGVAARFREQEKRREDPRDEINAARARLVEEQRNLQEQLARFQAALGEAENLKQLVEAEQKAQAAAEEQLGQRAGLETALQSARQRQADARAENPRLKAEMDQIKERQNRLREAEGAICPVCGQPLSAAERDRLIDSLEAEGKALGDRFRANRNLMSTCDEQVRGLEAQIAALGRYDNEVRLHARTLAQHTSKMELIETQRASWETSGAPRLAEVTQTLEQESYAPEARQRLAEVDAELKAIGYDAAEHDAVRKAEIQGRTSEARLRALETARAALSPLEREIAGLEEQIAALEAEAAQREEEYTSSAASLAAAEAQAPDLDKAEDELLLLAEQENRLRIEVGAARQKVEVLDDLRTRKKALEAQREERGRLVSHYRQLERAFGKDGVPALLIEQALPQIEAKSNEILERLSGGNMSVRFVTQSAYKDKRRDDLRETLDILISDSVGTRDYEMFSGGEAFRVNFSIRLALAEVLAQRAGARLQTLVVDEGFGSQDNEGRQRLIEAINLVRAEFAKILVITHIDELKDAFPNRIEVEKTERGSTVRVI